MCRPNSFLRPLVWLLWLGLTFGTTAKPRRAQNTYYKIGRGPTHLVHASRFIHAHVPYRVLVTLFQVDRRSPHFNDYIHGSLPATIEARLLHKGSLVSKVAREAFADSSIEIELSSSHEVDISSSGDYAVEIEGNHYGGTQGSLFLYSRELAHPKPQGRFWAETSRKVYYFGQTVQFRIYALDGRGRPWDRAVEILLWGPHDVEIQRWANVHPRLGLIDLAYDLANPSLAGVWTLEVVEAKMASREAIATPCQVLFRVCGFSPLNRGVYLNVHGPSSAVQAQGRIRGLIEAGYVPHPQFPVSGHLRLKLNVTRLQPNRSPNQATRGGRDQLPEALWRATESQTLLVLGQKSKDGQILNLEPVSWKTQGIQDFEFFSPLQFSLPLTSILREVGTSATVSDDDIFQVRIVASLTDARSQEVVEHQASFILYRKSYLLGIHASSCQIYDSFPITLKFWITRANGKQLTRGDLDTGSLELTPTLTLSNGHIVDLKPLAAVFDQVSFGRHWWKSTFTIPHLLELSQEEQVLSSIYMVTMKARYITPESISQTETISLPVITPPLGQEQIYLTTSSKKIKVGDNMILHVRSRYTGHELFFLLHAEGRIISSRHIVAGKSSNLVTFDELATDAMAPMSTALVWSRNKHGEIIVSTLKLYIESQRHSKVKIQSTSHFGNGTVHVSPLGPPGMFTTRLDDLDDPLNEGYVTPSGMNLPHWSDSLGGYRDDLWWLSDGSQPNDSLSSAMSPLCACARAQCLADPSVLGTNFNHLLLEDSPKVSNLSELLWKSLEITRNGSQPLRLQYPGLRRQISVSTRFIRHNGPTHLMGSSIDVALGTSIILEGTIPTQTKVGENVTLLLHLHNMRSETLDLELTVIANRKIDIGSHQHGSRVKKIPLRVPPRSPARLSIGVKFLEPGLTELRLHTSGLGTSQIFQSMVSSRDPIQTCWTSTLVDLSQRASSIERMSSCSPSGSIQLNSWVHISSVIHSDFSDRPPTTLPFCTETLLALKGMLLQRSDNLRRGSTRANYDWQLSMHYQMLLHCRNPLGYFALVPNDGVPSLWLTAVALEVLYQLFSESSSVDARAISGTLHWLTAHQAADGSFAESYLYHGHHDHQLPNEFQKMALTAQVVISLSHFERADSYWNVTSVSRNSASFLRSRLRLIERASKGNEYELALVARALQVSQSPGAETSFEILAKRRQNQGDMAFFGDLDNLSPAARATAIALQVYLDRGELLTETLSLWLSRTVFSVDGFSKILIREALAKWSATNSVGSAQPTASMLSFNLKNQEGHPEHTLHVSEGYGQKVQFPGGIRGQLWLEAQGNGRALVAIETTYWVPDPPKPLANRVSPFKLDATVTNSSRASATGTYCLSWKCPNSEKSLSGPVKMSVSLPTGYHLDVKAASLASVRARDGIHISSNGSRIRLQFAKLTSDPLCVSLTTRTIYDSRHVFHDRVQVSIEDEFSPEYAYSTYHAWPKLSSSSSMLGCDGQICLASSSGRSAGRLTFIRLGWATIGLVLALCSRVHTRSL